VSHYGESGEYPRPNRDSPRWCDTCQEWGEHHTDRCPVREAAAKAWRDPGKPEHGADWWDVLLYGILAVACVVLAVWLCTRHVNPCPGGYNERTSPTATVCTNPRQQPRR
jgi:hypothetical protein